MQKNADMGSHKLEIGFGSWSDTDLCGIDWILAELYFFETFSKLPNRITDCSSCLGIDLAYFGCCIKSNLIGKQIVWCGELF